MQKEIDPQLASLSIIPTRREVPHRRGRIRSTVRVGWEKELHVVVKAKRGKAFELLTLQHNTHHLRRQCLDSRDCQIAAPGFMANPPGVGSTTHGRTSWRWLQPRPR